MKKFLDWLYSVGFALETGYYFFMERFRKEKKVETEEYTSYRAMLKNSVEPKPVQEDTSDELYNGTWHPNEKDGK